MPPLSQIDFDNPQVQNATQISSFGYHFGKQFSYNKKEKIKNKFLLINII
jgi:hypothetical protein